MTKNLTYCDGVIVVCLLWIVSNLADVPWYLGIVGALLVGVVYGFLRGLALAAVRDVRTYWHGFYVTEDEAERIRREVRRDIEDKL